MNRPGDTPESTAAATPLALQKMIVSVAGGAEHRQVLQARRAALACRHDVMHLKIPIRAAPGALVVVAFEDGLADEECPGLMPRPVAR